MDFDDVTVLGKRGDDYLLVPSEMAKEGVDAPVFRAVIYSGTQETPLFEHMSSIDSIARQGYWMDESTGVELPDASELLRESHLKRLGDSDFGEVLAPPPLEDERG